MASIEYATVSQLKKLQDDLNQFRHFYLFPAIEDDDRKKLFSEATAALHDIHQSYVEGLPEVRQRELQRLVSEGVNKLIATHKGNIGTALFDAATQGMEITFLKELLTRGANIGAVDTSNYTPLHYAAENGHLAWVQGLVENKPMVVDSCSKSGQTPLHLAAANNHINVVQWLVLKGNANMAVKNKDSKTAENVATNKKHAEIVKFLKAQKKP